MIILKSRLLIAALVSAAVAVVGVTLAFDLAWIPTVVIAIGTLGLTATISKVGIETAGVARDTRRLVLRQTQAVNASIITLTRQVLGDVAASEKTAASLDTRIRDLRGAVDDLQDAMNEIGSQLQPLSDVDRRSRVSFGRVYEVHQQLPAIRSKLMLLDEVLRNCKDLSAPLIATSKSLSGLRDSTLEMGDHLGRGFTNLVAAFGALGDEVSTHRESSQDSTRDFRADMIRSSEIDEVAIWQTSSRALIAGLDLMPALVGLGHFFASADEILQFHRGTRGASPTVVVHGLSEAALYVGSVLPEGVEEVVVICSSAGEQELALDLARTLAPGSPVVALLEHEYQRTVRYSDNVRLSQVFGSPRVDITATHSVTLPGGHI